MDALGEAVYNHKDGIVSMGFRELTNHIYQYHLPSVVWDLVWDEFADLLWCGEGLHAVASITSSDISGYIARESWPPVVACDKLQGFPTAWVACCWCIVVESEDVGMEALVSQDVDPSTVEHHSFALLPLVGMDPL